MPCDYIFDPFAGTSTTLVVCYKLNRNSISIEIDPNNVEIIQNHLLKIRAADNIQKFFQDYLYTENLRYIWDIHETERINLNHQLQLSFLG